MLTVVVIFDVVIVTAVIVSVVDDKYISSCSSGTGEGEVVLVLVVFVDVLIVVVVIVDVVYDTFNQQLQLCFRGRWRWSPSS